VEFQEEGTLSLGRRGTGGEEEMKYGRDSDDSDEDNLDEYEEYTGGDSENDIFI
jgi:hypothetical protein